MKTRHVHTKIKTKTPTTAGITRALPGVLVLVAGFFCSFSVGATPIVRCIMTHTGYAGIQSAENPKNTTTGTVLKKAPSQDAAQKAFDACANITVNHNPCVILDFTLRQSIQNKWDPKGHVYDDVVYHAYDNRRGQKDAHYASFEECSVVVGLGEIERIYAENPAPVQHERVKQPEEIIRECIPSHYD